MYYAQLDGDNICRAVSELGKVEDESGLVALEFFDVDKLGRKFTDGVWSDGVYPDNE
jgi:hypothetical protein